MSRAVRAWRRGRLGGLAILASARTRGQGAGRAEVTGSREGAKSRSSDEKRIIFCQSPCAASVEPFLGKGHPGPQPSSARRARLPAKRSGSVGWSGLRARRACLWQGQFSGRGIFGNSGRLLIILADNYNQTTNDPTTETQSARRTHRDFFSREIRCGLHLCDSCGLSAAAPGQSHGRVLGRSGVGCCLWPSVAGRAVLACGDVVRAGGLSWQAIVPGDRRPVGPRGLGRMSAIQTVFQRAECQ